MDNLVTRQATSFYTIPRSSSTQLFFCPYVCPLSVIARHEK
jgi:hypothetical protein